MAAGVYCRIGFMESTGRFTVLTGVYPAIRADAIINAYTREDLDDSIIRKYIAINCKEDGSI